MLKIRLYRQEKGRRRKNKKIDNERRGIREIKRRTEENTRRKESMKRINGERRKEKK